MADFTAAYRRDSSPVLTCPHAEKTAISAMSTDVVDSTFHFAMRADRERLARFLLDDWDAADRSSLAAPLDRLARLTDPELNRIRRAARKRWAATTSQARTKG